MAKNEVAQSSQAIQIPLDATPANFAKEPQQLPHMMGWELQLTDPATAIFSALSTTGIAAAATKNNLGTPRPSELMVGLDKSNRFMYFVPVRPKTEGATPVKYKGGQCHLSLYISFAKLDRLVPEGIREYYQVKETPGEVTIGGTVRGWGLYIDLTEVTKEPIKRLSDEEKARRAEKRRRTIAAKKAAKEAERAARESAPGEAESET